MRPSDEWFVCAELASLLAVAAALSLPPVLYPPFPVAALVLLGLSWRARSRERVGRR